MLFINPVQNIGNHHFAGLPNTMVAGNPARVIREGVVVVKGKIMEKENRRNNK